MRRTRANPRLGYSRNLYAAILKRYDAAVESGKLPAVFTVQTRLANMPYMDREAVRRAAVRTQGLPVVNAVVTVRVEIGHHVTTSSATGGRGVLRQGATVKLTPERDPLERKRTLVHELRHVTQFVLSAITGADAGLPKRKARSGKLRGYTIGDGTAEGYRAHNLADVEFWTDLTEHVSYFLRTHAAQAAMQTRDVGAFNRAVHRFVSRAPIFGNMRAIPARYRQAVAEFVAAVQSRSGLFEPKPRRTRANRSRPMRRNPELPPYEPVYATDGTQVHPGDRVHVKLWPKGSASGVVVVSPRSRAVIEVDGARVTVPALSVDIGGVLYPCPGKPKRARR